MSDLYDSLEDDCDEKNSAPDSLNELRFDGRDHDKETGRNGTTVSRSPFYLNRNVPEEKSNHGFQCDRPELEKKNFLPKIDAAATACGPVPSLIVDSDILRQQGLQINNDGSFTKSPRPFEDALPFITPEYRNLQFQKAKAHKFPKKMPRAKTYKKNISTFTKNPVDGIIRASQPEKGSSEEILTSRGSLSPFRKNIPEDKRLLPNDNLTDSMKEQLLSQVGNAKESLTATGGLKKTKRVMNLLEDRKSSQPGRYSSKWQRQAKAHAEPKQNSLCGQKKKRTVNSIPKQQSDIGLTSFKRGLTYSERLQLKSGFNPLHLRRGRQKLLSDTTRSNFGDSLGERLSEISSRVLSSENLPNEEEESFYRELIEKDKEQRMKQRSSRSEGPSELAKVKSSVGSSSCKEGREVRQITSGSKPVSKSMSIDIPSESVSMIQTLKKYSHYCSADSSPNMSKFELALKAKTYGYMVNARNIFKMKAQSDEKLTTRGEKDSRKKNSDSEKKPAVSDGPNKHFPNKSLLPEIRERLLKASEDKTKKQSGRADNCGPSGNGQHGFALPRVIGAESGNTKIQTEILNRMSSYLNGPNGRVVEGVVSPTVK